MNTCNQVSVGVEQKGSCELNAAQSRLQSRPTGRLLCKTLCTAQAVAAERILHQSCFPHPLTVRRKLRPFSRSRSPWDSAATRTALAARAATAPRAKVQSANGLPIRCATATLLAGNDGTNRCILSVLGAVHCMATGDSSLFKTFRAVGTVPRGGLGLQVQHEGLKLPSCYLNESLNSLNASSTARAVCCTSKAAQSKRRDGVWAQNQHGRVRGRHGGHLKWHAIYIELLIQHQHG